MPTKTRQDLADALKAATDEPEKTKVVKSIGSTELNFFDGLMSFKVSLVPVKKSLKSLKLCCPQCDEASEVSQQYQCKVDPKHVPFTTKDAHRMIEVDGVFRKATDEDREELKETTVPDGDTTFSIFHASEVEKYTLPAGSTYRLRPQTGLKLYAVLVDMLRDESLAFICEMTYKGTQKMYRCISRDGMLWLRELIRPSEFNPTETFDAEYPGALLELATENAKASVQTFDPEQYANVQRDRLAQLEDHLRDPNAPKPETVTSSAPKVDDVDSLLASLQASIDAKTPKKTTRKKAA